MHTHTHVYLPTTLPSTICTTLLTSNPQSIPTRGASGGCIHQRDPSCAASLHQSPARQEEEAGAGLNREAGERERERGFFGKGANPITGSGAAPVSLATLNSHFDALFLPLLIPFPSIFVPFPDTFSPFCYRGRHSRTLSKCESAHGTTHFPNSLVHSWEERCRKKKNVKD